MDLKKKLDELKAKKPPSVARWRNRRARSGSSRNSLPR
jgi:hypothetical protein